MARRRFFVPEVRRGLAELTGRDAEHLVRVLRAEAGQRYEISDNRDVYLAEITQRAEVGCVLRSDREASATGETAPTVLVVALIKFDRLEWLVEKATELGVTEIRPFEAARTERGLLQAAAEADGKVGEDCARSQPTGTARSSARPCPVPRWTRLLVQDGIKLLLDEDPGAPPIRQAGGPVLCWWAPKAAGRTANASRRSAAGWQPCSLGPNILRAETAALAGLTIVTRAE